MPINIPLSNIKKTLNQTQPPIEKKSTLDFLIPSIKETITEFKWLPEKLRPTFKKVGEFLTPKSEEEKMTMMAIGASGGLQKVGGQIAKQAVSKVAPRVEQIDPVQKVINVLKEAKPLRGVQERLYSQARSAKLAKMEGVAQKTTGEAGFYAEKGALKGELPKVEFESIRKQIGQKDIDNLFNKVKSSSLLTEWEKIPAREGLSKIFGELGGKVPTKNEIKLLKDVFGEDFTKTILEKQPLLDKIKEAGFQLANIPRSLMASFDLSAPLRQGLFLIGKPKHFFPAFAKQLKTFASEKAYKALGDEIVSRPTHKLMRDNKLAITELGSSLTTREEAFMSNWAEKIPGIGKVVRASGRAYTGFLNKLRADVFDDFVKKGIKLNIEDPKFLKDAADFINHATGRGSWKAVENAMMPLNSIFFSPRLTMSRLNLINPYYYAKLNPQVRKEALKSLFTFASTAASIAGLLKLAGAEIEVDPRNADFMKPKFGNKRYDILGGFQQPIRVAAQFISGKIISSTTGKTMTLGEGYKPLTRGGIILRFFEYKTSPIASFAISLIKGQTSIGEKVDIPTEVVNRFIPMVIQDAIDLYKEEGQEGIPMAIPAIFGVGVQSYGGVESYDLQGRKYPELNKELDRLKTTIGFPSTQAFGQELSNKEYKELRKLSGKTIADVLTNIIKDEGYQNLDDEQKKQLINRVVDKTKAKAKSKLFADKEVLNEIKKRLIKKGINEEEAEKMAKDILEKQSQ
jgi:hypothetical protein